MQRMGVAAAIALAVAGTTPGAAPAADADRTAGILQRDSEDAVRLAQRALQAGGYYVGEIDGIFGPEMLEAVRYYQQSNRLPMTGRLDYRTMAALTLAMPAATPVYGGAGADVSDAGTR